MKILSFEDVYKKEKNYFGMEPHKLTINIIKYKKTGNVLDLGCGEGRDAIFLAKKGFKVTAIDFSTTGIKNLLEKAKREKVKIITKIEDIKKFSFNKKYDAIISFSVLQFLKRNEVFNIIKKMKKNTKIRGLNIITAFNEKNPNKNFPFLFREGELKDMYKNWETIQYNERVTPIEKHGKFGKPHRHSISSIIARKIK